MAKITEKAPAKTKKATTKSAAKKSPASDIEKISTATLKKLQELGIDQQLQADMEWCLGSYKYDKNPSGLYEMNQRALRVLKTEKEKKTKGVTAKMITDLEKVASNGK